MDDIASRPRFLDGEAAVPPQEAPISPRSKDAARQLLFLVSGAAVTAAVVAIALTISVYLINRRMTDSDETMGAFCCPRQAAELAAYVNTSLNPCTDFFAYVCSNAIRSGHSRRHDRDADLVRALVTGFIPKDAETRDAGQFLTAYYKSCVSDVPHRELFLTTMASALIRSAWQSPGQLDTRRAFGFMVAVSVKYLFPSAIFVSIGPYKSAIQLTVFLMCDVSGIFSDAIAATAKVLREYMNTTKIELKDVASLVQDVCMRSSAVVGHNATYTIPSGRETFSREVWDIDDLELGLSSVDYSLQDVRSVEVLNVQTIRLIHDLIAAMMKDADGRALAKMTVFLVSHSVALAAAGYYKAYGRSARVLFDVCMRSATIMSNTWYAFTSEVFTTREKDAEAMAMFSFVKRAVYTDCEKSSLFEAEDLHRLKAFFKDVSLVTPKNASRVAVPRPSPVFAENLLRGRAYDIDVAREHLRSARDARIVTYAAVQFLGERRLILPASMYGYIYTGPGNNQLANAALLGRLMAEGLWYMVLYRMAWTSKTWANIDRFTRCFVRNYLNSNDTGSPEHEVATVPALGLSSISRALKRPDWHTVKMAWSIWRLSSAQLFYMLGSHHRCPKEYSPAAVRYINTAPTYVQDFARAFECPSGAPMTKPRRCLLKHESPAS